MGRPKIAPKRSSSYTAPQWMIDYMLLARSATGYDKGTMFNEAVLAYINRLNDKHLYCTKCGKRSEKDNPWYGYHDGRCPECYNEMVVVAKKIIAKAKRQYKAIKRDKDAYDSIFGIRKRLGYEQFE